MTTTTVVCTAQDGVTTLTMNRPDSLNALDLSLAEALLSTVERCAEDSDTRAVVLTGAGRAFCAGGDVKGMVESLDTGPSLHFRQLAFRLHGIILTLTRVEKPILAAVNGVAAGAGFSLALACDLLMASEDASFTSAYTRIGVSPDGGLSFFLPRLVGLKRAAELVFTNRRLTAAEGLELGFVNRVVNRESLATTATEMARELAQGPTHAFGMAKRLLYQSVSGSLENQLEAEREAIAGCGRTADFREGVKAFVEKRAPRFTGR